MIGLNIITGPAFFGGLLYGLNKRSLADYKEDKYAHYKLLSLTSGLGVMKIVGDGNLPNMKHPDVLQLFRTGLIGGPLISGTMFCMGMMLTKIPSKKLME